MSHAHLGLIWASPRRLGPGNGALGACQTTSRKDTVTQRHMVLKNRVPVGVEESAETVQNVPFTQPPAQKPACPGISDPEGRTHHFFNTILFQRVPVWAAISFFRSPMVSSVLSAGELRQINASRAPIGTPQTRNHPAIPTRWGTSPQGAP